MWKGVHLFERIKKIPQACHYIHFHIDDNDVINEVWNVLIQDYGETDISAVARNLDTLGSLIISFALGDESGAYLSYFQDVAIIGLLFFSDELQESHLKNIEEKRAQLKDSLSSAIGEATVMVLKTEEQLDALLDEFSGYTLFESILSFGKLYHFSGDDRNYYFCLPSENTSLLTFLIKDLPSFDASFQSLDKKVKFFQDQLRLMEKERLATDKFVSKLLYHGIGKKGNGYGKNRDFRKRN